jgi:hypothetical protein
MACSSAEVEAAAVFGLKRVARFYYDPAKIPVRQVRRLHEIADFFDADICTKTLVPMVTQTLDISLRLIDWCLVNWSKKHKIVTRSPDGSVINVYSCYKDALRHYRRRLFDPFRRRERIYFLHPQDPDVVLNTTVGQLNFTFWAINYGIFDSCRKHMEDVENEMVHMLAESKRRRQEEKVNGKKRKRTELTPAPRTKVHVYVMSQELDFVCRKNKDANALPLDKDSDSDREDGESDVHAGVPEGTSEYVA